MPALTTTPNFSQRLLGLFIGVQILFLLCGNFLPLLPHGVPDADEITDDTTMPGRMFQNETLQQTLTIAGTATRRYGELTGQMQGWSLFAPLVAPQATFLVTELHWNGDEQLPPRSVEIVSDFHPKNPQHYFHLPRTDCRLVNYEFRLSQSLWYLTDKSLAEQPQFWQEWVNRRVSRQWKSLRAYLNFQQQRYLTAHPDERPADELRLIVRTYPIPAPELHTESPLPAIDRPLVRWLPEASYSAGVLPLEAFDPVTRRYVELFQTTVEVGHE